MKFTVVCPIDVEIKGKITQRELKDLWDELRDFGGACYGGNTSYSIRTDKIRFTDLRKAVLK